MSWSAHERAEAESRRKAAVQLLRQHGRVRFPALGKGLHSHGMDIHGERVSLSTVRAMIRHRMARRVVEDDTHWLEAR